MSEHAGPRPGEIADNCCRWVCLASRGNRSGNRGWCGCDSVPDGVWSAWCAARSHARGQRNTRPPGSPWLPGL